MEQNPAVALFFALGVIIAASRFGGALARRFNRLVRKDACAQGYPIGEIIQPIIHQVPGDRHGQQEGYGDQDRELTGEQVDDTPCRGA